MFIPVKKSVPGVDHCDVLDLQQVSVGSLRAEVVQHEDEAFAVLLEHALVLIPRPPTEAASSSAVQCFPLGHYETYLCIIFSSSNHISNQ